MAIVKSHRNKEFSSTLRYVTQKPSATRLFTNMPEALGCDSGIDVCDEVASSMAAQASASNKCSTPCYHISISPGPEDDHITKDSWHSIINKFLVLTGLEHNQAVAYLHTDTNFSDAQPRPHAHLVVNRVGDDGRAVDSSWDWYKFQSAMRVLENEFDLEPTPSSWEVDHRSDPSGLIQQQRRELAEFERGDRDTAPTVSMRALIADAVEQAIARASTMQDIQDSLKTAGISVDLHPNGKLGWTFERDGFHFAGRQLGRQFSLRSVNKHLNLRRLGLLDLPHPVPDRSEEAAISDSKFTDTQAVPKSESPANDLTTVDLGSDLETVTAEALVPEPQDFDVSGDRRGSPAVDPALVEIESELEIVVAEATEPRPEEFEVPETPSSDLAVEPQARVHTSPESGLVKCLVNYAKSRGDFYNLDYTKPIHSALGSIQVQSDAVSIYKDDRCKFAASLIDGDWIVKSDTLTPAEKSRVRAVPQTPEAYAVQAHGKEVIQVLQTLAPHEFERARGGIRWQSADRDYRFEIDHNPRGTVSVTGFSESGSRIFSASISDGAVQVKSCDIPTEAIDQTHKSPVQPQRQLELKPNAPELEL